MIAEYIRDLCRICVERSEDYIRIYDKIVPDNTPFFYIINDVCQLDIFENDGFPEYICKDCFLKISEFMIFKRKSHDAKLNFLSMKISMSEASQSRDTRLDKEAVVATSIIVKEMTSEGVTLDVAQPGDIIEEVITMPFVVDYEEVVTDETYTLNEDQTYPIKEENEESPEPTLPIPIVDRKRNSKEREVAIILADGGSALLCKEKEKEVTVVQDTGQKVMGKVILEEDEEEESAANRRRSFVAQAYYRAYLEKKKQEGERELQEATEECAASPVQGLEDSCEEEELVLHLDSPCEEADLPTEEAKPNQESSVVEEKAPVVEEDEGLVVAATSSQAEVDSPTSEEGVHKAVCCKKKMLAISKSLALSRSMEPTEKVTKTESVVLGSDLDVLVEACGSREGSWGSNVNNTLIASVETPMPASNQPLESEVVKDALVLGSGDCEGQTDRVNSHDTRQVGAQVDSGKAACKAAVKVDRRGQSQGPRFRIPGSEPPPPKRKKKEAPASDAKQAVNFIKVIASEELRAKRQQLDLEQVGDIIKTSLSGKKTIQVSEVGPSGKVFHVEPTIVKLRGMPIAPGRHMLHSFGSASAEPTTSPMIATKREEDDEGERGGGDKSVSVSGVAQNANSKGGEVGGERQGKGRDGEVPLSSGLPVAMGANHMAILGNDDGTTKTLLLTAPKEENSSTPALAILLRPLKQEEEDTIDPLLEFGDLGASANSLQSLSDPLKMKAMEGGRGLGQLVEEPPQEDSETFCNNIRRRAKRAMLGCIKKTLDELERMQGQDEGQSGKEDEMDIVLVLEDEKEDQQQQPQEEQKHQTELEEDEEAVYTCVNCGQSSYSKAEMGWHMKEMHSSSKQKQEYYCTKCDRCFTKRYIYRLHMEMHEMVREEEEEMAKEEKESKVERPSSPFKCHYCSLQFSGRPSLLFHEASKHQATPLFSCALCSKKFLTEAKREAHQSLCSGNRLECELCHKEYNVGSITQHMRTHRGEKPYLCSECGKTFSQKGDLKRHTKQIHLGMEPIKPFLCSYCPKTFSAQSKLRIHERSHTKEKPFVCNECGKGFAHLATLRKHRENREFACLPVIEQAAKPYTCSICKKGWDHKYALTKHIAWVHEHKRPSRTFPCPYCSKVYYCRSQLTYHERTHTKEKPFVCGICDKSFMYNSVRKAHMAKDHGLKRSINDGPR